LREDEVMAQRLTRRRAIAGAAAGGSLPLIHIRSAGAAGKLSLACVDHFVPTVTPAMRALLARWGAENAVEVQADFVGLDAFILLRAEEAQARAGHDMILLGPWDVHRYGDRLEPMDDIVARLTAKYGKLSRLIDYLCKVEGNYRAGPTQFGNNNLAACSRIDLFARILGMDLPAIFPAATEMGAGFEQWTWDAFLPAAEKCAKAGYPFGLPLGKTSDSTDWVGALFQGFGAAIVDADGNITARTDAVRAALDYARRLGPFLPPDIYSWDNASNNRALISGKSALIFNPPSAWAVAVRDNPKVGEQLWTHSPPAGRAGRFVPFNPSFWGVWQFARNKPAAKALIEWLGQREQVEHMCVASQGYDIPPFISMSDFKVWETEGPPQGTLFNYPVRPQHHAEPSIAGWPAPPEIAVQMYAQATLSRMVARMTQSGASIEQTMAATESELEGFLR